MEVDYPRVTHPFAGLLTLAGFLPRLACVRHAASVRSEPGSNSPIAVLFLAHLVPPAAKREERCTHTNGELPQSFVDVLSSFQRPNCLPHCRLPTARSASSLRGG